MSVQLTMGSATLESVARKVVHIPGALPRIAAQVGKEALSRVLLGFRQESDPYGNPWAPLQVRKGRILQDKGLLRASFASRVEGTNVVLGAGGPGGRWADVHQRGRTITPKRGAFLRFRLPGGGWVQTKKVTIPARPMVPTRAGGVPSKWSLAFVAVARAMVRQVLA